MSHHFYNEKWQHAVEMLNEQIELENPDVLNIAKNETKDAKGKVVEQNLKWEDIWEHYATLYIRYIMIFRELEDCYDQMVHPQKRRDVKVALQSVMARILLLKEQLKAFGYAGSKMEYLNLDDMLLNLKLQAEDIEIPVPRYFIEEDGNINPQAVKDMYILKRCMKHAKIFPAEEPLPELGRPMEKSEAIRIIQRNERGRQGRLRAKLMRQYRIEEKKAKGGGRKDDSKPFDLKAATTAIVLGHLGRSKARKMRKREMKFIGMRSEGKTFRKVDTEDVPWPANHVEVKPEDIAKADEHRLKRKKAQAYNERDFEMQMQHLKEKVMENDGAEMQDELWEERYTWFVEYKRKNNEYPTSWDEFYREKHLKSLTPEQQQDFLKKMEESQAKKSDGDDKKKKKGKKDAQKKKGKKSKGNIGDASSKTSDVLLKGQIPELVDHMHESVVKFKNIWASLNESSNFEQKFDKGIAKETVKGLVREVLCPNVDAKLLSYLQNLVGPKVTKKGKGKGKKKKSKKKKVEKKEEVKSEGDAPEASAPEKEAKKKSKKTKGKKGGKKAKKISDGQKALAKILGEIPPEEVLMQMITRLVKAGIIKKLERPPSIDNLKGTHNILGSHYQKKDMFDAPSMAQLRTLVTIYGILPLGDQYVKDMQYKLPAPGAPTRTMLLMGPKGTGKTLISKAIAKHTNAIFMDLSPANVEQSLENKEITAAYVQMAFEVAKTFSKHGKPTVMYIDECERIFGNPPKNKKDADAKAAYARFSKPVFKSFKKYLEDAKKDHLKIDKETGHAPRVLIIGNSDQPKHEFSDKKAMLDFFAKNGGKVFFTPLPDYDTRLKIWRHYIIQTTLDPVDLELHVGFSMSILAHVSAGYSAGNIRAAVLLTLTENKVAHLHKVLKAGRRLTVTNNDFVSALSKVPFVYKADYKKFVDFALAQNGEKKRREIKYAPPEAGADDGKKKKRKK